MKVFSLEPQSDKSFVQTEEYDVAKSFQESHTYLPRVISLPNDRVFIIGGASDISCKNTSK